MCRAPSAVASSGDAGVDEGAGQVGGAATGTDDYVIGRRGMGAVVIDGWGIAHAVVSGEPECSLL